jgi:hypothetical protein
METSDWNVLHASIMQRLQNSGGKQEGRFLQGIRSGLVNGIVRPQYAIAAGLAIGLLGALWFMRTPAPEPGPAPREAIQSPPQEMMELGRYFRKSRALLTGLSNLDPPPDLPIDLSVEREISRQLIIEGRSLRGRNLDPRSDRLIGDLDKIMKRVSTAPEAVRPPDIQTIRSDIRGQNLLVKVRVAETTYSINHATPPGEGL